MRNEADGRGAHALLLAHRRNAASLLLCCTTHAYCALSLFARLTLDVQIFNPCCPTRLCCSWPLFPGFPAYCVAPLVALPAIACMAAPRAFYLPLRCPCYCAAL